MESKKVYHYILAIICVVISTAALQAQDIKPLSRTEIASKIGATQYDSVGTGRLAVHQSEGQPLLQAVRERIGRDFDGKIVMQLENWKRGKVVFEQEYESIEQIATMTEFDNPKSAKKKGVPITQWKISRREHWIVIGYRPSDKIKAIFTAKRVTSNGELLADFQELKNTFKLSEQRVLGIAFSGKAGAKIAILIYDENNKFIGGGWLARDFKETSSKIIPFQIGPYPFGIEYQWRPGRYKIKVMIDSDSTAERDFQETFIDIMQ